MSAMRSASSSRERTRVCRTLPTAPSPVTTHYSTVSIASRQQVGIVSAHLQ
jgi:hypothetical protein